MPEALKTPHATILLVDDDDAVRQFVRHILKHQGFHVLEAADGLAALEAAAGQAEPLDLLLTDVIMPKIDGLSLAQRLSKERHGLNVLFMSGFVEKSMLLEKHPGSTLLQKPFTPDALIDAVNQILAPAEQEDEAETLNEDAVQID